MKKIVLFGEVKNDLLDALQSLEQNNFQLINLSQTTNLIDDITNIEPALFLVGIDNASNELFTITAKLNADFNCPLLFLSSSFSKEDRVRWLTFGASDYIKLPFLIDELVRKIIFLTKKEDHSKIKDEGILIDLVTREVEFNGHLIKVRPITLDLLRYLIEHKDQIVTRDSLMKQVFRENHYLNDRKIDTHIKEIRKIIAPEYIITIRGVGYSYIGNSNI